MLLGLSSFSSDVFESRATARVGLRRRDRVRCAAVSGRNTKNQYAPRSRLSTPTKQAIAIDITHSSTDDLGVFEHVRRQTEP